MKIKGYIWIDEIVEKLNREHEVIEEVHEIFSNRPKFRFIEKGHREGENVYTAQGQTNSGRYLIVFFVYKKDGRALPISARDMTSSERKNYGKK